MIILCNRHSHILYVCVLPYIYNIYYIFLVCTLMVKKNIETLFNYFRELNGLFSPYGYFHLACTLAKNFIFLYRFCCCKNKGANKSIVIAIVPALWWGIILGTLGLILAPCSYHSSTQALRSLLFLWEL